MKKRLFFPLILVLVFLVTSTFATTTDNSILFTPEITNALNMKNWLSSGVNRALLAFSLGANAADDRVLGRADVLLAFMQNPTFVGQESDSKNLIAGTVTKDDFIIIYYSPVEKKAYVMTVPNQNGITLGSITLEAIVSQFCSECYRIDSDDMATCIEYVQSLMK